MRGFLPAFAVVRVYRDQLCAPSTDEQFELICAGTFSVLRVYRSQVKAEAEVSRLNAINRRKGAYYYCAYTRIEKPDA